MARGEYDKLKKRHNQLMKKQETLLRGGHLIELYYLGNAAIPMNSICM